MDNKLNRGDNQKSFKAYVEQIMSKYRDFIINEDTANDRNDTLESVNLIKNPGHVKIEFENIVIYGSQIVTNIKEVINNPTTSVDKDIFKIYEVVELGGLGAYVKMKKPVDVLLVKQGQLNKINYPLIGSQDDNFLFGFYVMNCGTTHQKPTFIHKYCIEPTLVTQLQKAQDDANPAVVPPGLGASGLGPVKKSPTSPTLSRSSSSSSMPELTQILTNDEEATIKTYLQNKTGANDSETDNFVQFINEDNATKLLADDTYILDITQPDVLDNLYADFVKPNAAAVVGGRSNRNQQKRQTKKQKKQRQTIRKSQTKKQRQQKKSK